VTQHLLRHVLALERRADVGGQLDISADDALDRIAAEPSAAIADERGLAVSVGAFTKPRAQRLNTVFP
jgi:hypothetical protein